MNSENGRIKKGIRNVKSGILYQTITMFFNFVVRYIIVKYLGKEILGLNGLFIEVIAMLSLAEMGVGKAIAYNLYKPLAEKDEYKLTQIMALFKKAYNIIALVVFVIGCSLTPFIQYLIKDVEQPLWYVRIIYLLFVLKSALSYLFIYKGMLLDADQKNYISSRIYSVFNVISALSSMIVLLATKSFVVYMITGTICSVLTNCTIAYFADKNYPYLKNKVEELSKEEKNGIFKNVKYLFISTLSGKITNSTDNILISKIVSTLQVGIYSNYSVVTNTVSGFIARISESFMGGIGNMMASETSEKCNDVLKKMTFVFYLLASFCGTGMFILLSPFVNIIFGKEYLLGTEIVLICVVNFFISTIRQPLLNTVYVSGLFKIDKNISLTGSIVNLVVSIILGLKIGILGIFIGTFITHIIQIVLKIYILYKKRFEMSSKDFYFMIVKMLFTFLLGLCASYGICMLLPDFNQYLKFVVMGLIAAIISLTINFIFYYKTSEMQYVLSIIKRKIH